MAWFAAKLLIVAGGVFFIFAQVQSQNSPNRLVLDPPSYRAGIECDALSKDTTEARRAEYMACSERRGKEQAAR
jgi:hypothetical protein